MDHNKNMSFYPVFQKNAPGIKKSDLNYFPEFK